MATAPLVVRKTALTTWEGFWYVLQCIAFGAGYFAKIPTAKALTELSQSREAPESVSPAAAIAATPEIAGATESAADQATAKDPSA
jgi:hypothetical protein